MMCVYPPRDELVNTSGHAPKWRIRRGKFVRIPEMWRGAIPTKTTQRERREAAFVKVKARRRRLRRGKNEAMKLEGY